MKKFRDQWAQHADPEQNDQPLPVEEQVAPAKPDSSFVFELKSFRFLNQDNGFFVAQGRANEVPKDIPTMWKGRFNKEKVTIKGTALALASMEFVGSTIECSGEWVMDPKFGLQYQFNWAREAMPSSIEALHKYLASGRIKGIGPATADVIVKKFGMTTLDVLTNTPQELLALPGITQAKLDAIVKAWEAKKATYQLASFFGLYGIGESFVQRIVEAMGVQNLEARVRANPYVLTLVDGIGFNTADKMALALGLPRQSPQRAEAMLVHLLNEYTQRQGHTACPVDDWFKEASQQLQVPQDALQTMAQELINRQQVVLRNLPVDRTGLNKKEVVYDALVTQPCVSLRKEVMSEKQIASNLARLCSSAKPMTSIETMKMYRALAEKTSLDPSQLEGALGVLANPLSILTGGPGTGKTTTLKSVIDLAQDMGWEVVLAAPTGRAAKRMEEAIGRPAATIHRTLKFNPKEGFTHNRKNPLFGRLFVVDEASMIDNSLGGSWLSALPDNARVVFVGDVDQLPSVGAGNFLKDMITSGVCPVFRLTRVHRQAKGSLIAEAAQNILASRSPPMDCDPWKDDFAWLSPPNGLSTAEINEYIETTIKSLVDGFLKKGFKKEDIQILSPQHDGLVGVHGLNHALRWTLNENGCPDNDSDAEQDIALGDRLLVKKNNYDKEIFNGDMGIVTDLDNEDGSLVLRMEDGKEVALERADRKYLALGYAITVHKSQGGERPVIIMPCSPSHEFSMNKNLLYTGITRGRQKVVVVGSSRTLHNALRKEEKMYRLTGLVQEINKLIPKPEAKGSSFSPSKSFSPR